MRRTPQLAWKINIGALTNSLEVARDRKCAVFTPLVDRCVRPLVAKDKTPQDTVMRPTTMYGVCKVTGELMGDYYHTRFGVDARSVRFPGLISNVTLPGGGTTDYAVGDLLRGDQERPLHLPRAVGRIHGHDVHARRPARLRAELMEADPAKLVHRNSFNIASMSFTPEIICAEIRKRMPDFTMDYDVDPVKESIARSWPNSLDDTCAREGSGAGSPSGTCRA